MNHDRTSDLFDALIALELERIERQLEQLEQQLETGDSSNFWSAPVSCPSPQVMQRLAQIVPPAPCTAPPADSVEPRTSRWCGDSTGHPRKISGSDHTTT